ncbi:MAG: hypothetical protein JW850_06125, partial [Thermoflexales bacterium]|nr:hypothetical protein [Thermoflexales bacterium]
AYRKLDFSDLRDPLGIVNAQLREQAEAAIKDKIATMSIEEVLTDKEPIIEELTTRLKTVAEGRTSGGQTAGEGLGIKIVTVQLKEAYVSSQRLWENLQAPFRNLQDKNAQVSRLQTQDEIRQAELKNRKSAETGEAEAMLEIERTKQSTQTEALSVRLAEEYNRLVKEQESAQQKIRLEEKTALIRQESEQRLVLEAARAEQERKLAELRRVQEEAVEHARLDAEAGARRKALEVEQALKEMAEETRLAENRLEAERLRIERDTTFKKLDAELALLAHEQDALLAQRVQEATLARTRQERLAQLELEEATNRVELELEEKQVGIARLQQEVENLVNELSLKDRLIEKLPELAAHMPEVHELKVLQTGPSDGAFDTLAAFLAKLLALAESLGLGPGPLSTAGAGAAGPEASGSAEPASQVSTTQA